MHSLKATWLGRTFALAKPNESGGKKSRVRLPKKERKAMVESFIKKHQKLNNGNFPSLSLTHREVGGSFYTIREIVREIIQENRVLGPAESILEEKRNVQESKQSQSGSILMEPVLPLSLSENGSHFTPDQKHSVPEKLVFVPSSFSSDSGGNKTLENGENINRSQVGLEDKESDMLVCRELKASRPFRENTGLLTHNSSGSEQEAGIQERADMLHDSLFIKPGDEKLENGKHFDGIRLDVDDKDRKIGEIICRESKAMEPVEVEKTAKEAAAAMTETMKITENASRTTDTVIDISATVVVETFPLRPVTTLMDLLDEQSSDLENFSEDVKGIGTDRITLEVNSSSANVVDLEEISSATSAVPDKKIAKGIVGQLENKISDPLEKRVGENFVNPASISTKCSDTKDSMVVSAPVSDANETEESSNGIFTARTTEENQQTSSNELGIAEKDITKINNQTSLFGNEAVAGEDVSMKEGKVDALDSSSSQIGSNATINRIKPESWKGGSKNIAGGEANPLLAVLKSFITALVKFWTE